MLMPPIDRYMTRQPWTISSRASISDALGMMREHAIRHLPVLDHGTLVGLVSERDLRLLETIGGRDDRMHDAMSEPVFTVHADAAVADVARRMSEHKYGSVVVTTKSGAVVGIFTMVDACRALAELLDLAVA